MKCVQHDIYKFIEEIVEYKYNLYISQNVS